MKKCPQVLVNLKVTREQKDRFDDNKSVQELIKKYTEELGENGRIVVRKSGTENLIRIMIEGTSLEEITRKANTLKTEIEKLIN